MFFCESFEIIKANFFIKHLRAAASECRRLEKSSWLLRFLILNDSILMNLLMGCRNFIYKLFIKERRKSLEFSEMFASVINGMIFMFDHCWKSCKSFINICYLYDFFSIFFSRHFDPGWCNGWSNPFGIRSSFLNYISVPFKYLMKNSVD